MPYKKPGSLNQSRRRFLQKATLGSALLLLANPLRNLFASDNQGKEVSWRELVDYARWCPTVHNLQPHRLKVISPTEAGLYYEPGRLLPVEDPDCRFVTVAMGVFVEHLSIAASVYGKAVIIIEVYDPINTSHAQPVLFAKLAIADAVKKETLNREFIKKRRTSRLHYDGHPLPDKTLDRLRQEASAYSHDFFSTSDKNLVDHIITLNQETLFEDISVPATRKELDRLFRYSEEEAKKHGDGLWSRCMNVPGAMLKSVFRHPGLWTGFRQKILSEYYKEGFNGTASLCWFGGRFSDTYDWLIAGSMLARCWLITTEENAYIHPFGSLITNANAYQKINAAFRQPSAGKQIWMIFRAGYSGEPTRSFRLETDDIILS